MSESTMTHEQHKIIDTRIVGIGSKLLTSEVDLLRIECGFRHGSSGQDHELLDPEVHGEEAVRAYDAAYELGRLIAPAKTEASV